MEKLWLKDWRYQLNQFKSDLCLWSNEVKSTVIIMVSQPRTRSRETLKGDSAEGTKISGKLLVCTCSWLSNSWKELNVTPVEIILMNHSELNELSSFNIQALEANYKSAVIK